MNTNTGTVTPQSKTKMLVINGLFIALTLVATMFINIRLPFIGNGGLIHLGNVPLFLGAFIYGRKTGAIAGGIGMGLFDPVSYTHLVTAVRKRRGTMKNTVASLLKMKQNGEKISMLTCYDYSTAKLMEASGINMILVGDSLGNTMLGYKDTLSVTMEDMIHHGAAVVRGVENTFVVMDMPFMSYQPSVYDAVVNAGRLILSLIHI